MKTDSELPKLSVKIQTKESHHKLRTVSVASYASPSRKTSKFSFKLESLTTERKYPIKTQVIKNLPQKQLPLKRVEEILNERNTFHAKSNKFSPEQYEIPNSSELRLLASLDFSSARKSEMNFRMKTIKKEKKVLAKYKFETPFVTKKSSLLEQPSEKQHKGYIYDIKTFNMVET